MSAAILIALFEKFRLGTLSKTETRQLEALLGDPASRAEAAQLLGDALADPALILSGDDETMELIYHRILLHPDFETPVIPMTPSRRIFRWIAAAILLVLLSTWLLKRQHPARSLPNPPVIADIAPGGNRAMLTLANGQQILLDSAANGTLAQQGNSTIQKLAAGRIIYKNGLPGSSPMMVNILTTPRGGQYQLTLPDGTKVWLDAASSIRYPTAFAGSERRVTITGEAYFEVARNVAMPFHVNAGDLDLEVLGTNFNINAYPDETTQRTTLLQGLVRVSHGGNTATLHPGQQWEIRPGGGIPLLLDHVDLDAAVAWKNGYFHFANSTLPDVMRQVARWYDVDIVYQGAIPPRLFGGEIARSSNASDLFKILEASNVHFKIDGKKIIVMP